MRAQVARCVQFVQASDVQHRHVARDLLSQQPDRARHDGMAVEGIAVVAIRRIQFGGSRGAGAPADAVERAKQRDAGADPAPEAAARTTR